MKQTTGPGRPPVEQLLEAGLGHHRAGRLAEAERSYRAALAAEPKHPEALYLLASLGLQSGHPDAALAILKEALTAAPPSPQIYHLIGQAFLAKDQLDAAGDYFAAAAELAPSFAPARVGLGRVALQRQRPDEAVAALRQAVALDPASAEAQATLGLALKEKGEVEAAAQCLARALALAPGHAETSLNLGNLRFEQGRIDEALGLYRQAAQGAPKLALAHYNLGRALQELGRTEEAEAAYRQAVTLDPRQADALTNLGNLCKDRYDLEAAAAWYRKALAVRPEVGLGHYHLGNVLGLIGEDEAAIAALERAIALDPGLVDAPYIRSMTLMMKGDFEPGLVGYETRKRAPDKAVEDRAYTAPAWDGAPLPDGRLLVWPEQGVGDHILYAALLPLARARVASCVVECDRRLAPMFARALPDIDFVGSRGESDASGFTHQLPFGDLMRSLKPWPRGFAPPRRFLAPDPGRLAAARAWLDGLGPGPRVGLSWRSAVKRIGPSKSLSLERWRPILAGRPAVFVNLQYGDTDADVAAAEAAGGLKVEAMPGLDRFADLEGLAALIDGLDLVLTTSNVTAHLAGALGKPCWLLLAKTPLWYWGRGLSTEGTLFYPSIRPYWQSTFGRWDDVVESVAADFGRWLASGGAG